MAIKIYQAGTQIDGKQKKLLELLEQLPLALQQRAMRYRNEQAAYNFVVGRLLLKQGLCDFGMNDDLQLLDFQANGKPIRKGIHFNISHSADQVICGFSENGRLGVDLEKIKAVSFDDLNSMFTNKEWEVIKTSDDPTRTFYWYWTRKESIIKALGLTLNFLHQIELDASLDYFEIEGNKWFLRDLKVGDSFLGAVCCEFEIEEVVYVSEGLNSWLE